MWPNAWRQWLFRTGSQPKKSVRRFCLGLAFFVFAAALIIVGGEHYPLLQIPGLLLLLPALFFAGWGYLGIFANRFSQVINRATPDAGTDDKSSRLK